MCWNEHVSLNTFIFSIFVLLLIAYNNKYTQYKIEMFNIKLLLFDLYTMILLSHSILKPNELCMLDNKIF